MIEVVKGDMFESGCEALVNAVNCNGHMGAGLALAFAQKWPNMDKDYSELCYRGELRPGLMHIWERDPYLLDFPPNEPKYIINFPTKDDLWLDSKIEYIVDGLFTLGTIIQEYKIASIAIPALGCGYGNLAWSDVQPLIEDALGDLDCHILLYEPH